MTFHFCFVRNRRILTAYQRLCSAKRITIDMALLYKEYSHRDARNLHVSSTILAAAQKRKDVFYLPDLTNHQLQVAHLLKMTQPLRELGFNLSLVVEKNAFTGTFWLDDLDVHADEFAVVVSL